MPSSSGSRDVVCWSNVAAPFSKVTFANRLFNSLARIVRQLRETLRPQPKIPHGMAEFRALFDAASETMILVDEEGHIELVNARVKTMFGYEPEALIGQSINVLIPERFHHSHDHHVSEYSGKPETRPMGTGLDLVGQRKDGSEFPVEISLSPVRAVDDTLTMALISDITRRKQLEEEIIETRLLQVQLQKEREVIDLKERFVSLISHEFRTPLTSILMSAGLLRSHYDRVSSEKLFSHLQRIISQTEHMTSLLDDILEFSKLTSDVVKFSPEPTDLTEFCHNIIEEFQSTYEQTHHFVFEGDTIPDANMDHRILRHVLSNLLSNAVKYSPSQSQVRVELRQEGDEAIIRVADAGIGIPSHERERVFEPFHRAGNATSIEGTGLGLSIVKQNVELHGGEIICYSEEGGGATFIVRLPLHRQN